MTTPHTDQPSPDTHTTSEQIEEFSYNPREYGKSFKAWQQFIALSKGGKDVAYRTPGGDICSPARVQKLLDEASIKARLDELKKLVLAHGFDSDETIEVEIIINERIAALTARLNKGGDKDE